MVNERRRTFSHEIAIVAIAKNEGLYIVEWLEYHKLVGITKIYFYDNCSTDNTQKLLQPYIVTGYVEYTFISGRGKQLYAYEDAIHRHKNECRYMAFIDLDEYLVPEKPYERIGDIVNRILKMSKNAVGIGVNWCVYGDSGHKTRVHGLITESYLYHASTTNTMCVHVKTVCNPSLADGELFDARMCVHVKTVCNPRMVTKYISPHYPIFRLGGISLNSTGTKRQRGWFSSPVSFKELRINHYYCKSQEDFKLKISRGLGDREGKYNMKNFSMMNDNSVYDELILVYKPQLDGLLNKNMINNNKTNDVDSDK